MITIPLWLAIPLALLLWFEVIGRAGHLMVHSGGAIPV